jgi:SpoVK/Ycf46/Vps4 family AAA+-type ATPase
MAKSTYQKQSDDEALILDLVRLGLHEDANSIRQLSRRLLRQRKVARSETFRESLGQLLLGAPEDALRGTAVRSVPVEEESLMPLLEVERNPVAESPLFEPATQIMLDQLIDARLQAASLLDAGIDPPRTVLLTGAPGVGKTMTARHLAVALDLPLMTVELAALMSSFLGKTGQNLRRVLDHARATPCLLFLDEFDAVAKSRDDATDTGELKRLVNLLLLELDRWPISGLLVAATNHPQLLDPAVERRFDVSIDLDLPGLEQRRAILTRAIARIRHGETPSPSVIDACALAFDGESGSFLERAVADAARTAVLEDTSLSQALAAIAMRRLDASDLDSRERRAAFAATANEQLGMTQREIADLLGISHPTVGKLIKEWRERTPS